MQEEALNKFFESNKWDTYSCYDIFKRLYSNIIALIRYNGSEKKTKGSPLKHCWGARVVFRTDRDPLCQILDIIRFNDPPPPDASVPPVPSPVYQAVHHGPCRVSSGCCHGGSLSSSLTSATLFSVRNDYIYTYIHTYIPRRRRRERVHRATAGSGELPLHRALCEPVRASIQGGFAESTSLRRDIHVSVSRERLSLLEIFSTRRGSKIGYVYIYIYFLR